MKYVKQSKQGNECDTQLLRGDRYIKKEAGLNMFENAKPSPNLGQ